MRLDRPRQGCRRVPFPDYTHFPQGPKGPLGWWGVLLEETCVHTCYVYTATWLVAWNGAPGTASCPSALPCRSCPWVVVMVVRRAGQLAPSPPSKPVVLNSCRQSGIIQPVRLGGLPSYRRRGSRWSVAVPGCLRGQAVPLR